jgi:HK97 family phage prohead protease
MSERLSDFGVTGVPFEVKFADGDAATPGAFEGYAAVFGNMDSHRDVIEPGAFANDLLERKREGRGLPPMYKMHGAFTGNSTEPVGVWDHMEEDSAGLHVKGHLIGLDTEQGKWNYAQLREGALKGLSIGYKVPPNGSKRGGDRPTEPRRFIKIVKTNEVSLVDDPSNVLAQVYRIKSRWNEEAFAEEIKTVRDFENFLRDVGGFSVAAAKAIATGGYKARPDPRDEAGIGDHIRARFSALAASLK